MKRSSILRAVITALAFAAIASPAGAITLGQFSAIGSGTLFTSDCTPSSAFCTATFAGHLQTAPFNGAAVTATLTINHSSGFVCIDATCTNQCFGASGTGMIKANTSDTITLGESGLLCSIAPTFIPETFNGTYFVEGGTGTFANEIGSGVATASENGSTTAPLILFSLDGSLGTGASASAD